MRTFAIFIQILFLSFSVFAQKFEVETIQQNGSIDHLINIVILGDGYTRNQLDKFVSDAHNISNAFFNEVPFSNYRNYFNIFLIKVPSNVSGAADNPNAMIDNYFGSTYNYASGIERLLYPTKTSKVMDVLANNFPKYDQVVMIVNDTRYGGGGGWLSALSTDPSSREIFLHEFGHAFANLADEYWAGDQYASEKINMTRETNLQRLKWKNWYGDNDIGLYSYSESPTWHRPHQNCKMRYLGRSYCSVCIEGLVEKIHSMVSPLVSYNPVSKNVTDDQYPLSFQLNLIEPVPNTLQINWNLNNAAVGSKTDELIINQSNLIQGANSLTVTIEDATNMLRIDNHHSVHSSLLSWNIEKKVIEKPVFYTLTFNSLGGNAVASQTVTQGEKATQPGNPVRAGYTFAGWYKDLNGVTAWDFAKDVVTDNLTLYAKWIVIEYTVSFNSHAGYIVSTQKVKHGDYLIQPDNPVRTGYTFAGWYKEPDGITAWNFATDAVTENITLYAKWNVLEIVNTVMFNTQDGRELVQQIVKQGDKVIKPNDPVRTGYIFAGWYKEMDCVTLWRFDDETVTEDITLYAKWIAPEIMFTVMFNTQDGRGLVQQIVKQGDKIVQPDDPVRTGYTFVGWYKEPDCVTLWRFDDETVTEDITLYAKWTAPEMMYFVMFHAQDGRELVQQIVKQGDKVIKPNDPVRTGFIFDGWYKEPDGVTAWDFASDVVTEDITLYAKWVALEMMYTVTFNTQDGRSLVQQIVSQGNKIIKPDDPVRAGYTFAGWHKEPDGVTAWDFATNAVTEDITLYAKWMKITNTEDFPDNELKVFPNPFTGQLQLSGAEGSMLQVITESGSIVHIQNITSDIEILRLDELPAGIYFFRIEKEKKMQTMKIVKN